MDYDIYLDFQLLDTNVLPEDITQKLGIKPTLELKKGERDPNKCLPRQHIWSIQTKPVSDDVADHWKELSSMVLGLESIISEIIDEGKGLARLSIVINGECEEPPSIVIPPGMSLFAGRIGAEIDID